MFLLQISKSLASHEVNYALTGGYAVSLHGAIRATLDIDIVINWTLKDFEGAEAALKALGLISRVPVSASEVFNFREEYLNKRNMKAWGFVHPDRPSEMVDIVITHDLKNLKTIVVDIKGNKVPVLDKKSLILMKEESGRPQDIEDISALNRIK